MTRAAGSATSVDLTGNGTEYGIYKLLASDARAASMTVLTA